VVQAPSSSGCFWNRCILVTAREKCRIGERTFHTTIARVGSGRQCAACAFFVLVVDEANTSATSRYNNNIHSPAPSNSDPSGSDCEED
jgi:hypothetical protein